MLSVFRCYHQYSDVISRADGRRMKPGQVRQGAKISYQGQNRPKKVAGIVAGKVAGVVTGDTPAIGPHRSMLHHALGHPTSHKPTRTPTLWGVDTEECLPLI